MHDFSLPRLTMCLGTCLVLLTTGCGEEGSAAQGDGLAGSPGAAGGTSGTGGTLITEGSPPSCNDGTGTYIDHAAVLVDDSGVFVGSSVGPMDIASGNVASVVKYTDAGSELLYEGAWIGWDLQRAGAGAFLTHGWAPCGVAKIENGELACSAFVRNVDGLFVLDEDTAYAGNTNRLLAYDGELWTQLGPQVPDLNIHELWANEQTVIAIGVDSTMVAFDTIDGAAHALPSAPAAYPYALWASAEDDLWLGNDKGQLVHFDGSAWSVIWSDSQVFVRTVWGAGDTVFFSTGKKVFRVRDGEVEPVAALDFSGEESVRIFDIGGTSENDVYVVAQLPSHTSSCSEPAVLRLTGDDVTEL